MEKAHWRDHLDHDVHHLLGDRAAMEPAGYWREHAHEPLLAAGLRALAAMEPAGYWREHMFYHPQQHRQ